MTNRTTFWNTPYTFSAKEKDVETGYGYFGARYYDSGLSIWLSVDPMSDKYPSLSSYMYCAANPIILVDPDGNDWRQRQAAINQAINYLNKNPGNSYQLGSQGTPGNPVDCSGMVRNLMMTANEKDPYIGTTGRGVERIVQSSTKVTDMNNVEAGNIITFNTTGKDNSHVGIIIEVIKDSKGNTTGFIMIDSGGKPSSGKSGPRKQTINLNDKNSYWTKAMNGVYKWDSVPDKTNTKSNTSNSNTKNKSFWNRFKDALLNSDISGPHM